MSTWISRALLATTVLLAACSDSRQDAIDQDSQAAGHAAATEPVKGTHGGRLLSRDGVAVELAIAEDGMPPTYKAWLYRDQQPLPPEAGTVEVRLTRLGGIGETHALLPVADGSLMAKTVVGEPHSFDVEVLATVGDARVRWAYPSYEGRTLIDGRIAADAGIRVAPAASAVIADQHEVQGLITPIEGRVAMATARFPGLIRQLNTNVGDEVRAGQLLATIESNLSLSTYPVASPIAGVVLARSGAPGGIAAEGAALFEIADLSSLWVDLHVFGADATHIRPGAAVTITRLSDGFTAETTLERVLPGTATASQSTVARATLPNPDGMWRPGSAVSARITVAREEVSLAVPLAALQVFRDWDVVFVRVGDTYEVRPLQLGRRDAQQVEVLSGIAEGDDVVVEQSYLVKADIEKSGASHDH
jgi:cobalt-zinc-cadmium efflux system membrane fusion protein